MQKYIFSILCIALHGTFFAGGDTPLRDAIKFLKKVEDLSQQDVLMHRHIPTLKTFALAHIPQEALSIIPYFYQQEQALLKNTHAALPQDKESFWFLCLTCDRRLYSITPSTTSPDIRKSIEAHGYLVPQKTSSTNSPETRVRLQAMLKDLQEITAVLATEKR